MARDFNGATDRIDWSAVANLAGSPVTISAWIYSDGWAGNGDYIFNAHISGDSAFGVLLYLASTTGVIFYRNGSTDLLRGRSIASGNFTGAWHHVLVTHDGTFNDYTTINIYIDGGGGAYADSGNGSGEIAASGSWSVGGRIFDDNRNFDGKIAEVAVWNTVLSTGTISSLASGRVATAFPDNLLFYWMGRENDLFADPNDTTGTADGTTFSSLHPTTNFQTSLSKTLDGVTFSSSGTVANPPATGRTATLAKTLDGVVFSSVATNANFADLSKTLGNVTSSSSGTVAEIGYQIDDIILEWLEVSTATLDKTLGNATLSSSAKVATDSDLSKTLGSVTNSSVGKVSDEGDLSKTLGTASLSSSSKNSNLADASKTLDGVSETSSGLVSNYTDLSTTLESIENVSSGTGAIGSSSDNDLDDGIFSSDVDVAIVSTLSKTLANVTLSSSGFVGIVTATADLNVTLESITNVSSATNAIGGDEDTTLDGDTFDAEADVSIYGNSSTSLSNVSLTSSGVIGLATTGTLDVILDGVSSSGAGTVAIGGDLSVILAAVTLIATGIVTPLPVTPSTFLPRWKYDVPYYDRNYVVSEYNRTHRTEDTEG